MKTLLITIGILAAVIGGYYWYSHRAAEVSTENTASYGKINIDAVCEGALAYMTFPDGASADVFVSECKEGKHPEVIERYKAELNLGDGAAI